MKYSQERKQAVLAKLAPPYQRTVKETWPLRKAFPPRPSTTGASRHAGVAACSRMMAPIPRAGRHGTSSLR